MRRGFKCREEVLNSLKNGYDKIVEREYNGNYLKAIQHFEYIAEEKLRELLDNFYYNPRSRDQAWKTCKGSLYEYTVFRCIKQIIVGNSKLSKNFIVLMGDEPLLQYKDQIVIHNWSDIFPDVDILIVEKKTNLVKIIISCKTSLRERLTETTFWKRELEKTKNIRDIKLVFVTSDRDNELKIDTNRYILFHVINYTFVTDPEKYKELVKVYHKKYGKKEDFNQFILKVKFIEEFEEFLNSLR